MAGIDQLRERLKQRYIDALPSKVAVLKQALESLVEGLDSEAEETTRRLAHQIRGSAASFGFPELGVAGGRVEDAERDDLAGEAKALIEQLETTFESESANAASVLLVDDDDDVCSLVVSLISSPGRAVHVANTAEEARAKLRTSSFDLIVLDLILPDADGRNLLAELRANPATRDVAVLVLSVKGSALARNECAIHGVVGFLEKPIEPDTLPALVSSALQRQRTYTREAFHDDLTRLKNRFGFRQVFEQMLAYCRRTDVPMALALLDIDHFKRLNDTYGHETGDLALVELANHMRSTLRKSDVVGRWGGEEFVIGLPSTSATNALTALRKLATAVRSRPIAPGCPGPLTFSGGVVAVAPEETLDLALLRADQLLYGAKRDGRDRVLAAPPVGNNRHRLLLAEDDPEMAALLLGVLRETYDVAHARDGAEALALAEEEPSFDLVILDYNMPKRSGIEVLRALKAADTYAHRPVIMLTAIGRDEVVEDAFAAGADDYIMKPFRPRALLSRLRSRIRSGRGRETQ